MNIFHMIRTGLDQALAAAVMVLVLLLSLVVVLGFTSRMIGVPLSWTGEIAGIGLAWLTFYGSALAASRGAHIASPSILAVIPARMRVAVTVLSEAVTIAFFILLAVTGMRVVDILAGSNLVSVPFISQQLTQSAVPVGAALFIVAEVLRLPEVLRACAHDAPDASEEADEDIF